MGSRANLSPDNAIPGPRIDALRRIYFNEHSVRRFLVEPGKLRVDFLGCARFHNKQFLPKGVAR